MDFVFGSPKGKKGNDAIWVIIDRLTKSALFLPMKMIDSIDKLARLHINEVVWLHGVPIVITQFWVIPQNSLFKKIKIKKIK